MTDRGVFEQEAEMQGLDVTQLSKVAAMSNRQEIESCPNLPTAKFIGKREVMLTNGDMVIALKNEACDQFERGWHEGKRVAL
jgi:hypothetical protein